MSSDITTFDPNELDPFCFACGHSNPSGLHLQFAYSPNMAHTRFRFDEIHQGWSGIVHGGLVATVLDEVMAHAVNRHFGRAVTASVNVRFRQPLVVGELVLIDGEVVSSRQKVIQTRAVVKYVNDEVVAEATANFVLVDV